MEKHIPKLINKYLYGIHRMNSGKIGGQAPVQLLYALHPVLTNEDIATHISFYNKNHGLFSKYPIRPAVGAISLSPDKDSDIDKILVEFFKLVL